MILKYSKDFDKSIKKLRDKIALNILNKLIEDLENAQNLSEISNVEPITNHPFIYRIKRGDFRLVVEYLKGDIHIILLEYLRRNEKTYRNY
jgi:mRNA-degrading endonuclease RelE of RelBE toxin-antitoxin system